MTRRDLMAKVLGLAIPALVLPALVTPAEARRGRRRPRRGYDPVKAARRRAAVHRDREQYLRSQGRLH